MTTDDIVGALVVLPVEHYEVHEGETFSASFVNTTLADNAVLEILLQTGAKYAHVTFFASCGGDARVTIVENPTVSDAGTGLTEHNNKRYSDDTATVTATHTPTETGGTVIIDAFLAGGTGGNAAGGLLRANTEFILKANEDYTFRVTNLSGGTKGASLVVNWYEESTA